MPKRMYKKQQARRLTKEETEARRLAIAKAFGKHRKR